ncbi:hypothetical protein AVEN_2110-1 [Araneus ventricosus]|uniref:Uncharacterized protein n=1 Tax=Araneus ventricosus TaxID=182803 RepID=A0A4Y2JQ14_ARAVE|nr:hypothetical protein AVEN_2110-1 [Araneus ventricosus]
MDPLPGSKLRAFPKSKHLGQCAVASERINQPKSDLTFRRCESQRWDAAHLSYLTSDSGSKLRVPCSNAKYLYCVSCERIELAGISCPADESQEMGCRLICRFWHPTPFKITRSLPKC